MKDEHKKDNIKPFINVTVGMLVKDEMEFYNWDVKDFAREMGETEMYARRIINDDCPIHYQTAQLLSRVFRQSPEFWMNVYKNSKKK